MEEKQLFSTDEELAELGNYLINSDDVYEEEIEYDGKIYKIEKSIVENNSRNDMIRKTLIISNENKKITITAKKYIVQEDDYNHTIYDRMSGWEVPIRVDVDKYSLTYNFENCLNSLYCFLRYQLQDLDQRFTLSDFQENKILDIGIENNSNNELELEKNLKVIRKYHTSRGYGYGTFTIGESNIDYEERYSYGKTTIKYSKDASKILDVKSDSNKDLDIDFLLKKLSTKDDLNSFIPEKEVEKIYSTIKFYHPDYIYNGLKETLISDLKRLKDNAQEFIDRYMNDAIEIVDLHNKFIDELSSDENGKQ